MRLLRQILIPSSKIKVTALASLLLSALSLLVLHVSWQRWSGPPFDITSAKEESFNDDFIPGEEDSLAYGGSKDTPISNETARLPTRPAIIAAARADEDVKWMAELTFDYELYPYNVDDRDAAPRLAIPQNKGHEAMVYLTYIINNYNSLPPYAVFVHGHKESWHQEGSIVHLVKALRVPALQKAGYVPLRCDWYPSCPAEINPITKDGIVWGPGVHRQDAEDAIEEIWDTFFPGVEVPHTIASQCCAQFAVTREAILRRPKEQYLIMREWLLGTTLHDDISGRVLEKLWAYIMTDEPVHCPSPHSCACDYFGHCEAQHWPKPPKGLPQLPADSLLGH
ncbi:hypothetical protein BDV97DRAFT_133155 [Delphinella strobiligena]|nr:hypothetical protein BDV97DRAFT_133155 [Delphinella strobiligena]